MNLRPIPFNDLARGTRSLRTQIDEAVGRVLSSGWYVLGPEHDAFEHEIAAYLGVDHAVGVGNGTDALQLALAALGVEPGDLVMTAANAGGYTSTAARSLGAVPFYADVDPVTHLVTVATLDDVLRLAADMPRVLVVTHLYGSAADIHEIVEWAHIHDIAVIEDCAQSLGAVVDGVKAGSVADMATTSFYPTKNLGALGDGGAVFTSDPEIARKVRQLRQYGWESKYRTTVDGGRNSRLDELQAAILRVKLPYLDEWNQTRRAIHSQYEEAIGSGARLVNTASERYVGHLAVLTSDDRQHVQSVLARHGVAVDIHYPTPDHRQPVAAGQQASSLPTTDALAGQVLSLPLFPELEGHEVDRICAALSEL